MRPITPPLRLPLFVSGTKPEWMTKALGSVADALILDLEDSVPSVEKAGARGAVAEVLARPPQGPALFVRINDLSTSLALADLQAVVGAGLKGIMIPKVGGPADIHVVDRILGWLEALAGLPPGEILILPTLETAYAMCFAYDIALASPRVAYVGGLAVRGGDVEEALGYRWSREGWESLSHRSQILMQVRAAGVVNPVSGLWTETGDLDGLRGFAEQSRDLGYEGLLVIHPSHVAVVNAVFSPSEEEAKRYRQIVDAVEAAERTGVAAVSHDGHMIDTAMARRAAGWLARRASDNAGH